jgi:RNA 3'-terminal phosphate cyclase
VHPATISIGARGFYPGGEVDREVKLACMSHNISSSDEQKMELYIF